MESLPWIDWPAGIAGDERRWSMDRLISSSLAELREVLGAVSGNKLS
jgi:hypothetical protein